jgi:hypothetical protein
MKFHQRLLARIFGKHEGKRHTDKSNDQAVFGMLTMGLSVNDMGRPRATLEHIHLPGCVCDEGQPSPRLIAKIATTQVQPKQTNNKQTKQAIKQTELIANKRS